MSNSLKDLPDKVEAVVLCEKSYCSDHEPDTTGPSAAICRFCGSTRSERRLEPGTGHVRTFCLVPCTFKRGHGGSCGDHAKRWDRIMHLLATILIRDHDKSVEHAKAFELLKSTAWRVSAVRANEEDSSSVICALREVTQRVLE